MNALAAAVVAAVLVAGSGCSSHAEQPEAKSTSTNPGTPQQTTLPTTPGTSYDVRCIAVSANMAQRIASGEQEGVGMVPGMAVAVKSPDLENVYFVAMQFKASGVAETQMGVWAVTKSVKADTHGRIMAVDGSARRFTGWPRARYPSAVIHRSVNFTVGDAAACLLK